MPIEWNWLLEALSPQERRNFAARAILGGLGDSELLELAAKCYERPETKLRLFRAIQAELDRAEGEAG